MRNKYVGYLFIGVSVIVGIMIWLFNRALTEIVNDSCSHGSTCPMWGNIRFHTNLSIMLLAIILLIGLYLTFFGEEKKEQTGTHHTQHKARKLRREDYKETLQELENDDKLIFEKIIDANGSVFQSDLVNHTDLTKVKVTRILDRLEGKGLIERRRRGMTNVIILKHERD